MVTIAYRVSSGPFLRRSFARGAASIVRVTFCGGTDEVGASCVLIEAGGRKVLLDCGIRMGGRAGEDRLPDLAAVGRAGDLDALVLTHAHLDHTGAAPLLLATAPSVPVFATAPTIDIMEVLLRDASKIMEEQCGREEEIPLYPPEAVDVLLASARPVPFLEEVDLCSGEWTATFFPAGHVLGASMVGLTTPEGRVLVTGDFSVGAQRTIPGSMAPRFRPDLVVCESTYGGRLHANRAAEEKRLVEAVGERIEAGGKVLVPAFALGRAQEVILVLERAMRQGRIPSAPIFVDGMVRSICSLYARYPELLQPDLRRRILNRQEDPFFGSDGRVQRVVGPGQRDEIVKGPPCVVVSSSGMLSGGPSVYYAAYLFPDPQNLVAITGYQDEEAPGRRLLDLADKEESTLVVGKDTLTVRARVSKYALSAHADEGEIVSFLSTLRARDIVFVHGDGEARRSLARAALSCPRDEIRLPELGDCLEFTYRGRGRGRERKESRTGIGGGEPLDDRGLEDLWLYLVHRDGEGRLYTAGDLLATWSGGEGGEPERRELVERLTAGKPGYEPDRKRPFLFRLVEPGRGADPQEPQGPLDPTSSLVAVRELLGGADGFVRCGIDDEGRIVLYFDFPDVEGPRCRDHRTALAERTGREVTIHPEANLTALVDRVTDVLPEGLVLARNPSFLREEKRVKITVSGLDEVEDAVLEQVAQCFFAATGFDLAFEAPRRGAAAPETLFDAEGRMEINAACGRIRSIFDGAAHRPGRLSRKSGPDGPFVDLSFVSPVVGARYRDLIERAAEETGWDIRIGSRVDQQAVQAAVRSLVPPTWTVVKGPGIHAARGIVKVRVTGLSPEDDLEALSARLAEETGLALQVEPAP